jgi:hypothetical protein
MQKTQKPSLRIISSIWLVALLLALLPQAVRAQSEEPAADHAARKLYLPVVADDACSATRSPDSHFGIQLYGDTRRSSDLFPYLQGTNSHWMRVSVGWEQAVTVIQEDPLVYNWSNADRYLAAARDACVNVIVTIDWKIGWNSSFANAPFTPKRHAEFARFMQAIVERYDGDGIDDNPRGIVVRHWELYNEPDFDVRWGNRPADYAAMLKAAYPAIKAASSEAKVLFGGIAYDGFTDKRNGRFVRSFFDEVLKAGGGPYFDIMNFHYYPGFRRDWTTTNSTGLPEKLAAIRALLTKHNLNKPVVVTETSWPSNSLDGSPSSQEDQSRYLVQLFAQGLANDIQVMIWWLLQDSVNSDGTLAERQSGLITATDPVTPKRSYNVFRAANTWLGHARYVATASAVTPSNNLEAYQFRSTINGERFFVAWLNPVTTTTTQPFQIAAARATVFNKEGVQISTHTDAGDGAADGKVTVQVGGSPVYIFID